MLRNLPVNWFNSSARPVDREPTQSIEPTLDLDAFTSSGPDRPEGFGRKCSWLAIRCDAPERAMAALGIARSKPCGWQQGIATAFAEDQVVFVAPPVQGWTLVVAPCARFHDESGSPEEHLAWLSGLSARLGDVHYYSSHRGVDHYSWSRAVKGEVVRSYRRSDELNWSIGEPTSEESSLLRCADEDAVLELATAWSVDPEQLDAMDAGPSRGWIGLLPPTAVHLNEPSVYQRRYPEVVPEASAPRLACNVYWNAPGAPMSYVFEAVIEQADGRWCVGADGRTSVREHASVPSIARALRKTLNRFERVDPAGAGPAAQPRGDEVAVQVEQVDGRLSFWPTRRRWGRLRRHEPGRVDCRWDDRVGIVAWSLDQSIVCSMSQRPLWRRLVDEGREA